MVKKFEFYKNRIAKAMIHPKKWFVRRNTITAGIVISVGVLAGCGSSDVSSISNNKEESKREIKQASTNEYSMNDFIDIGENVQYKIIKVEEKSTVGMDDEKIEPKEGYTFVAMQFVIKNVIDTSVSPGGASLLLVDDKGKEYQTDYRRSAAYALEHEVDLAQVYGVPLEPNTEVIDFHIYEVPKEEFDSASWHFLVENEIKVKLK